MFATLLFTLIKRNYKKDDDFELNCNKCGQKYYNLYKIIYKNATIVNLII